MKKIIKSLIFTGSSETFSKVSGVILFLYYYKILPKDITGALLILYSLMLTFWILIDLGSSLYGTKLIAASEEQEWDDIQILLTKARLFMALIFSVGFVGYALIYLYEYKTIAYIFAANLVMKSICADWRMKGEMRFKELSGILTTASLVLLVSGLLVGFTQQANYASIPWLLSTLIVVILSLKRTLKWQRMTEILKWKPKEIIHCINGSKNYAISNGFSAVVQQSPILVLGLYLSTDDLASYALIHRIVISATFSVQMLGNVIYPWITKNHGTAPSDTLYKTINAVKVAGIITTLATVITVATFVSTGLKEMIFTDISNYILILFSMYFVFRATRVIVARYMLATSLVSFYSVASALQAVLIAIAYVILGAFEYSSKENITLIFMLNEAILLSILGLKISKIKYEY